MAVIEPAQGIWANRGAVTFVTQFQVPGEANGVENSLGARFLLGLGIY
ncbi:hypothetical protein [Microseira wollei]|nr:hypothetical protein [Microseira wollei]